MRKSDLIISYLHPVVIESTGSPYNPVLEVIVNGGKYMLNSRNTNYSYGPLHILFKRAFKKLKPNWSNINTALILGFGTGCVAETITSHNPDCIIDGVEIDTKVIELGKKYYNTHLMKNVMVHCESAENYMRRCRKKYDLIVIDVYLDIDVPEEVESETFLLNVRDSLRPGGIVMFNKYVYSGSTAGQVQSLKELYKIIFGNLSVLKVLTTGRIFVAEKLKGC